jgi:nucleotide-binding universal stress UspA family protein
MIVPLDGSELAESVLPHVEALAKGDSARVTLLRVCEPPSMPTYYSPELSEIPLHWGQYAQQETARCKQMSADYLADVQKRLNARGIATHPDVLVGKASDEVVSYANKSPSSLIVMATHGRSGLSRLVYGSVTANILVGAANPIFLVKPKPKGQTS